ncbi:MAG: hypothetical protein JWO71_1470 [Candidatus Acidoferrum typicum]|nr:hypothetical protein [Candidatus Acidoferrum typicum]
MSPFRPFFFQPPVLHPDNDRFFTPLFSISSELLFSQLLCFHNHLRCPLVCAHAQRVSTRNPLSPLPLTTSLQTQQLHAITHSFAQRHRAIPPVFNRFRTLSIATGVYPPPGRPLAYQFSFPRQNETFRHSSTQHSDSSRSEGGDRNNTKPLATANTCGALHFSGYRVLVACLLECLILVATRSI